MPFDIDPNHLAFLTNDIARYFRAAYEREIGEANIGVTPSEARVLVHLARTGPMRQIGLAERLGVAPMSLSVFLDRLEALGLVARRTDPEDRRAKQVSVQPEAAPILKELGKMGQRINDIAFEGVDPEAQRLFVETALVIRRNLETRRAPASRRQEETA